MLWGLQHFTDLGNVSAGIVMAVSNIMTAVMSLVILRLSSARSKKKKGQTQSKANVCGKKMAENMTGILAQKRIRIQKLPGQFKISELVLA